MENMQGADRQEVAKMMKNIKGVKLETKKKVTIKIK